MEKSVCTPASEKQLKLRRLFYATLEDMKPKPARRRNQEVRTTFERNIARYKDSGLLDYLDKHGQDHVFLAAFLGAIMVSRRGKYLNDISNVIAHSCLIHRYKQDASLDELVFIYVDVYDSYHEKYGNYDPDFNHNVNAIFYRKLLAKYGEKIDNGDGSVYGHTSLST